MRRARPGRLVFSSLLLLLLLPGIAPSGERLPDLDDRDALLRLEEMERSGILRDPIWAQAYWARSRSAPTAEARVSDLRWSLRFDPELTAGRFDLAWVLLRQGNIEFAAQIAQAATSVTHSFALQQRLLLRVLTLAAAVLLLGLVSAAWILLGQKLPRIRHAVWEKLHFLPQEIRAAAALLTVGLPLVLVLTLSPSAAVLWSLLLATAGAWTLLRRWERRVCVSAIVVVLAAPAGLAVWSRLAQPSYPHSYLRGLWENQSWADPAQTAALRTDPPAAAAEDPDYYATLALAARRNGDLQNASRLLERAVTLAPTTWAYYNNLGNIHLLSGHTDAALVEYNRAAVLAPEEPLIYVNQAQAWMKKLHFTQADAALARATNLGYHFPALLSTDPRDTVVRDRRLGPVGLWQRFVQGIERTPRLAWSRVPELMLALVFPMRPFWLSLPLFLTLFYVAQVRRLPRVHRCGSCGRLVCRKCHYRVLRRNLCATCYALRQEIRTPLKREAALAERRRRVGRPGWIGGLLLSAVLPGSGLLLRDAPRRAGLLMATSLTLLLILCGEAWELSVRGIPASEFNRATEAVLGLGLVALAAISISSFLRVSRRQMSASTPSNPDERSA